KLFHQAAMHGKTVVIASGDLGPLLKVSPKRKRGVDPMTASSFVTAVGGTTPVVPLDEQAAVGAYGSEVVWQEGQAASGGGRGAPRARGAGRGRRQPPPHGPRRGAAGGQRLPDLLRRREPGAASGAAGRRDQRRRAGVGGIDRDAEPAAATPGRAAQSRALRP